MIKVVALDFDGVVIESADIKTEAFRALYSDEPEVARQVVEYHSEHEGVSRYIKFKHFEEEIAGRPYTAKSEARLDAEFSRLVRAGISECPFVPGAVHFLERFAPRLPLYVVSGTPDEELAEIVVEKGIATHFKGVMGSSQPKPVRVRQVLDAENIEPDELLFVGDAMSDWRAARETGAVFVGRVPAGEASHFPEEGTSALVQDLDGLSAWLDEKINAPGRDASTETGGA